MTEGVNEVTFDDTQGMRIIAVEVKDLTGKWVRIKENDIQNKQNSISSYTTTSGFPREYDIMGKNIRLEPAPTASQVTLSSGLRVWTLPEIDAFTSADTTQEVGFAEPFHRIASVGASCDWLAVNGPDEKHAKWLSQYEQLRAELREFYGDKNEDVKPRIEPVLNTSSYI